MDFIILLIGWVLLWVACDVKRPNDKIELFSIEWFLQLILMLVGVTMISTSYFIK